jgi:hypothetical protein
VFGSEWIVLSRSSSENARRNVIGVVAIHQAERISI